jgi:hypothetical protein
VLTLIVAGGVGLTQARNGSVPGPGQIAGRAATAALARPSVRPGQWVFRAERLAGCSARGVQRGWSTANAVSVAWRSDKKIWFYDQSSQTGWSQGHRNRPGSTTVVSVSNPTCRQQPVVQVAPDGGGVGLTITGPGASHASSAPLLPTVLSYASLGSLPRAPQVLERLLGGLSLPASGLSRGGPQAFFLTYALLSTYVPPAGVTAGLYRGLGDLPGITVDARATDVAGRAGLGLRLPLRFGSGLTQELVFAPRSYRLLGYQVLRRQRVVSGVAILRQALVRQP